MLAEVPAALAAASLLGARQEPFVELHVQGARTRSFVSIVGGGEVVATYRLTWVTSVFFCSLYPPELPGTVPRVSSS